MFSAGKKTGEYCDQAYVTFADHLVIKLVTMVAALLSLCHFQGVKSVCDIWFKAPTHSTMRKQG